MLERFRLKSNEFPNQCLDNLSLKLSILKLPKKFVTLSICIANCLAKIYNKILKIQFFEIQGIVLNQKKIITCYVHINMKAYYGK